MSTGRERNRHVSARARAASLPPESLGAAGSFGRTSNDMASIVDANLDVSGMMAEFGETARG